MKIAVVGATGRIGAKLARTLLGAGHQVRALSRGGPGLDALVKLGAEPFVGSFDEGTGDLIRFFEDADAAFLMVKTDWNNIDDHYLAVSQRIVDALRPSPVRLAVSLSAMGSEVDGKTGHFELFHQLDRKLNELDRIDLVHLRAAWFMENTLGFIRSVAENGRIAWYYEPDLAMPWVATDDIAWLAAKELTQPTGEHRVNREAGSEQLTMRDLAGLVGREVGKPVEYRLIDRSREDVKAAFLAHFGKEAQWEDDDRTADAMNSGTIGLRGDAVMRPPLPTSMADFVHTAWKPKYDEAVHGKIPPESFMSWAAGDDYPAADAA